MNIRIPRSGKAAKIAQEFLKTLGFKVPHAQALELIARLHGYPDWHAMDADTRFAEAPALKPVSSNEYELTAKQPAAWVTVDTISVSITRTDEGVVVDLYAKGKEDDSLAGTGLTFVEAEPSCGRCGSELDSEGYCTDETCPHSDWPQQVPVSALEEMSAEAVEAKYGLKKRVRIEEDGSFEASERIRTEYLQSPCSRHDVNHALAQLNEQCSDIFPSETAMWEFLMDDTHEDNESEDNESEDSESEAEENVVLVYGDHFENFVSEDAARNFIQGKLPVLPNLAYRENADGKELRTVTVSVDSDGQVSVRS